MCTALSRGEGKYPWQGKENGDSSEGLQLCLGEGKKSSATKELKIRRFENHMDFVAASIRSKPIIVTLSGLGLL